MLLWTPNFCQIFNGDFFLYGMFAFTNKTVIFHHSWTSLKYQSFTDFQCTSLHFLRCLCNARRIKMHWTPIVMRVTLLELQYFEHKFVIYLEIFVMHFQISVFQKNIWQILILILKNLFIFSAFVLCHIYHVTLLVSNFSNF